MDGSEGNYYTAGLASPGPRIRSNWSPTESGPATDRLVHYVESSPADQLQPKHSTREYTKPGDTLDIAQPVLFDVEDKKAVGH